MKETNIDGLYILSKKVFEDNRGTLIKPFSINFLSDDHKLNIDIKEVWFTKSKLNVIRAMHFQMGGHPSEKYVSAISGKVQDVILDLRPNSKTFKNVFEIELTGHDDQALYIPVGCAHGYKVLEENTTVMYMATQKHVDQDDIGIHWQSFGHDWKIENPILSEKDINLPSMDEYLKGL